MSRPTNTEGAAAGLGTQAPASDEWLRSLTQSIPDAVVWVRDGLVVWASPALSSTLGWPPDTWMGTPYREFTHPDDLDEVTSTWQQLQDDRTVLHRYRVKSPDGRYHWVEGHAHCYVDGDGHRDGVIETLRPIDTIVKAEQELERRAKLDPLTGLLNRAEMMHRLTAAQGHPRRSGEGMAVLFCDIDRLKPINDMFGHQAGDELIRIVAHRIQTSVRTGDLASRVGGDEFLILLTGISGLDDAVAAAEKIRSAVGDAIAIDGHTVRPSLSIGIALVAPGADMADLVRQADSAMYSAKRGHKDGIRVAPMAPGDLQEAARQSAREDAGRDSLEDRAVHVHGRSID